MNVYASDSVYVAGPSKAQQEAGTVPLDTLPADWWNWLWKEITTRINESASDTQAVFQEILSVLQEANIEPSATATNQLTVAIKALASTIGTAGKAGAVKSSTASGKVSIDSDGVMTPNGMGTPTSLNTTTKNIVDAINEVLAALNTHKTTTDGTLESLDADKAPNDHASTATTYGKGTTTKYGHLKISDTYDSSVGGASDGIAASQKALYDGFQAVMSGIASVPTGVVTTFAGTDTAIPSGWLLCNGQAVSRTAYPNLFSVIGVRYGVGDGINTFNVPDLRDRFPQGANNNLGQKIAAGLPNITGTVNIGSQSYNPDNCSGAFTKTTNTAVGAGPGSTVVFRNASFNASNGETKIDGTLRNDVYGKSDTVQPPALSLNYIIKI